MNKDNKTIQTENQLKQHQNDVSFNLFETNIDFNHIYKRTERIVSAIYLLTNHFGEREPMKWTLRNKGNQIITAILDMRDLEGTHVESLETKITNSIAEIISLFEVAHISGIVSENNCILLKKEFLNLITISTDYINRSKIEHITFASDFFNTPKSLTRSTQIQNNPIGHSKGQNVLYKKTQEKVILKTENKQQNASSATQVNVLKNKESSDFYEIKTPSDMRKNNRRNLILNTIKKHGGVMIKDLIPVIKGCSEKTIQRELSNLITSGLIKREGERRWSVYKMT